MSINSRAKGATWERAVVNWFKGNGWPFVERRIAGMADDRGDLNGLPGVVVECKAAKALDLAGWVDQLEQEIANSGADTGVVIIKRRGLPNPGQAYAVMPMWRWAALMKEAGR